MKRIFSMMQEPSTWAGLAVLGGLFHLDPSLFVSLHGIAVGVAGVAAVVLPEKKAI